MVTEYTPEQLINYWERFFEERNYLPKISSIADAYPEEKSIVIKYWGVDKFDRDFADYLLAKPYVSIYSAEQAVLNLLSGDQIDRGVKLHVRIIDIPSETSQVSISRLRAEHLGKFIALEGTVRNTTEVRPMLTLGVYQCLRCYAIIRKSQEHGTESEPLECIKEQGGCGRATASTAFNLIKEKSTFLDVQRIELMELTHNISTEPEKITITVSDDLTGILRGGQRVKINGILRMQQRRHGLAKLTVFDIFLEANSIEIKEHDDIELSESDEQQILKLSKKPDLYEILVNSFAPTIYGMEIEKFSLLLQVFGGVTKYMPDGTKLRGFIHMALIGDPSTAKSQLADAAIRLASISGKASGKNATTAGLTATVERDNEFGGGRWTLKPGGLVLANNGVYCVDEIDKLKTDDVKSLHEPMEQGEISVAKASINARLQANTSILAIANPKYGRFDEYRPIPDQVTLDTAFLSRFDVIFPIKDKVDKQRDTELAAHILRAHQSGEMKQSIEEYGEQYHTKDEYKSKIEMFAAGVGRKFLRKYIAYSKRIIPVLTDKSLQRLNEYYVSLRSRGDYEGTISCTPRQLEGLIRLAEACARMRLSNVIEDCDVERVIEVCEYYLSKVASDGGVLDIDVIATGTPKSKREKIIKIIDVIESLDVGKGAHIDELREYANNENIEPSELDELLMKLKRERRVFNPSDGTWKVV